MILRTKRCGQGRGLGELLLLQVTKEKLDMFLAAPNNVGIDIGIGVWVYMKSRRTETIQHINRILGQINTLKAYVEEGRSCHEVATLTTSIAKSFDSLRSRTLEGFILLEILQGKAPEKKKEELAKLLSLYKK